MENKASDTVSRLYDLYIEANANRSEEEILKELEENPNPLFEESIKKIKAMKERIKELDEFKEKLYEQWKGELIRVIVKETGMKWNEVKLKQDECRKCFDSGMSPYQAFRESS